MLPLFGDERRREINLGGSSSVTTSQTAILNQARARRIERETVRKRQDSAVTIQAWWRGITDSRRVRQELRELFTGDVTGLTGLRCLVLIGQDTYFLDKWAVEVLSQGSLFSLAHGRDREHWLVLMRQVFFLLLRSVSDRPRSERAVSCLQVLCTLLNPASAIEALGSSGNQLTVSITEYAVRHDLYQYLARSIQTIGPETKNAPTLPFFVELIYRPLNTLERSSEAFLQCFRSLIIHILTTPLLPNRIPISSLTALSAKLPLSSLSVLSTSVAELVSTIPLQSHVHLIANLYAFTSPRYAILPLSSLKTYLQLMTASLSILPVHVLDPPSVSDARAPTMSWADDGDSESEQPQVTVVTSFAPTPRLPPLDARTQKRLQILPSPSHLNSLLKAAQHDHGALPDLVSWLVNLCIVCPTRKSKILSTLLLYGGGGLVREIYRDYVRNSPLGKNENMSSLMDPSLASAWPPLLLLTELYTQSLLTMGDDEFFSNSRTSLSLDELVVFSRALFNIAFTLYWRDDQTKIQEGGVPGLNLRWVGVRDKITKCLQAIHARDSRKPFMPENHWHISSQIDMNSFIDAAVFEEQQLDESSAPRTLTKRQLSHFSPRLGVLNNIPFAVQFETRVLIFRRFVENDKWNRNRDTRGRIDVSIRRGHIAQDGYDRLAEADLRAPIAITFIDQFGEPEAGIDGGGVFKEFFTSLCKEVFDTDRGLWLETKRNEIYPNPHSYATEPHNLNWYRFIGRILGKALYKGILVEVAFAGFFLAKWLDKQSFLDDLASLDPDLYQGLIFLKNYTGDVEDLALNFTVAIEEFGVAKAVDLIPDGSNVPVTRENRLQYIYLTSHYRLSKQIKLQSEAFFEGLSDMIDPKWLRMFNQQELQILLGGVNAPVDVQDLRTHTQYGGLYDNDEPTIQTFWKVLEDFDQEQRRLFLRFVTSCSRPPLLGFKQLNPLFAIRDAGSDEHRLPTSSTCVNLLKLPRYTSEQKLRDKLLQAISSGAGFDLS
ncbi:HECT-domain-containing protein [Suillus plorans]|uniref:HECT-type E3 ubiquitin transferase n=1 Tax=Suillus plorans TaxID=116603 RepID=A0A9P7D9K1_9AGAM|nr:HECT-domain-containing protein [Suillus plorans]KAG1784544.1 HECT-domain-containing protein [Suillus plorans]